MNKIKILAIGEIIFDIFDGEAEIGGAPLNFCAHCVASGAESAIISAVGGDSLCQRALDSVNRFGVNSAFIQKSDAPTGQCIVTLRNGIPEYNVLRPAAYDKIEITDGLLSEIRDYGADVFAFGTLIQRDEASRKAVKKIIGNTEFREVFCDLNLRTDCYDRESCLMCLKNATILKISDEEEPLLREFGFYKKHENAEGICKSICESFGNIKIIAYTMGEKGSVVYEKASDKFHVIPCFKTNVVSTVGAGDSYSAAFLCGYLKNGDTEKAAYDGARLSALVVSHREAVPVIPKH